MSDKKIHSPEYWESLINEFRNCRGISMKEFCSAKGVGFSTFCRWKSKFSKAEEHPAVAHFIPLHIEEDFIEEENLAPQIASDNSSKDDGHNDLDDRGLQLKGQSACDGFDLHIGEKIWVKIPVGFNEFELKRLVGVLC